MDRFRWFLAGAIVGYVQFWLRSLTEAEVRFHARWLAGRKFLFGPKEDA